MKTVKIKYEPQPHQSELHNCNTSLVAIAGRQIGKTICLVNELIKRAVITPDSRNWYVTNDYRQAKRNVWDVLKRYCPDELLSKSPNETELRVDLVTGSRIELIGVENAEKLRGAAVNFMGLDEYADFKTGVFEKVLEPMLTTTNGDFWFMGCVTKDTFIFTDNGMRQIGENKQGYVDVNESIYGLNGFNKAIQRFGNPETETIKIITAKGFEIEGTPNHKIMTHCGWKRLDSLKEGDFVTIQSNNGVFGSIKEELAYLIGLYLAEGYIEFYKTKNGEKPSRITITNKESANLLKKYGFKSKDGLHWRLNSKKLAEHILEYVPRNKASNKYLSNKALSLNKESMRFLLQGYFDGDGFADSKRARIGSTSSSKKLSKQIQMLLLNFGILSSFSCVLTPKTKRARVESMGYRVIAEGYGAYLFYKKIGFKISRKKKNIITCNNSTKNSYQVYFDKNDFIKYSGNIRTGIKKTQRTISVYRLKRILKNNPNDKYNINNLTDKIKVIRESKSKTSDFVIPETHSYFSNGFISHNTPKGLGNDLYYKYQESTYRKFKYPSCTIVGDKVTSVLSKYTSIEKMQEIYNKAREEGKMDWFNQEYLADFVRPAGVVYKQWNLDHFIKLDYDDNLPLHLTFDFGVNDPTSIIWIQPNGAETRVIDYYEATDADINHFVQVIKAKPYKTPEFCTGDIAGNARDIGTNKSPIKMLQEAGFYVKTSKIPNIPIQIRSAHRRIANLYVSKKAERFRDILLNYRYPEPNPNLRNQSNEVPLHDEWSHGARAFEYWCWNYDPPEQEINILKRENTGQDLLDIVEAKRKAKEYLSWV
jgi:intein/homing endonuclease